MFVRLVVHLIINHRGLPGRYAKILGDVPPEFSRLGLVVSRPTRQVCAKMVIVSRPTLGRCAKIVQ
ncbi:hypothetical protein Hanom_Chr10g00902181 [Helianthus anomalus]